MIRQFINRIRLKFYWGNYLKKRVSCPCEWYGNTYGGFYVNPSLLMKDSIVYSFGIGEDVSFDETIIKKHDCDVFAFDPTPKSISWVKNQRLSPKFKFFEFGLGKESSRIKFFLPKNKEYVSGSIIFHENVNPGSWVYVEVKSLEDIISELGHSKIDLLKIDIEGSEYDIIDTLVNMNASINQIAIEFHDRFFQDGKSRTIQAVEKMRSGGYQIFAVSKSYQEISFIKTERR